MCASMRVGTHLLVKYSLDSQKSSNQNKGGYINHVTNRNNVSLDWLHVDILTI